MTSYAETYSNWVNGLPQSKREKLAKAGLDKPLIDYQTNTPDDTVIFAKMGVEFDYDALDAECDVDSIAEIVEERAKAYGAQLLSWVFARLQAHKSARSASIDRDALEGRTETAIAAQYGITKAAFSVRVKSWQKLLGLSPSSFMRSEKACRAYRNARLKNLTRR